MAFLAASAHADIKVEYRISPVHGLIKFVFSAAEFPHQSKNLRELYQRSTYKTKEAENAIESIRELQPSLDRGIQFHTTSFDDRADGMEVSSFIEEQSIFSQDLKDLGERIAGTMPLSDYARFIKALKTLEPLYKKLIWEKSLSQLKQRKREIEKIAKDVNLNQMFKRTKEFYRAEWPAGVDFVIGLFPVVYIKGFHNSSNGTTFGAVEEYGIMIGQEEKEDGAGGFGVIFHELSHALYAAQPPDFMEELSGHFINNPSPYQLQAHTWFNEAVATAIGNGWAADRANPKKHDENWYNNPTVQTFAKAIYPLTKSYLEEGKAMDKAYVDGVIKAFAEVLPDSIYNFDGLLNRVVLLSDQRLGANSSLEFRKNFFMQSMSASSPINGKDADTRVNDQTSTLILMVSDKGFDQLKSVATKIKLLERNLGKIKKLKPGAMMSGLDKGRAIIVFKTSGQIDMAAAVRMLKAKGKIDREGSGALL